MTIILTVIYLTPAYQVTLVIIKNMLKKDKKNHKRLNLSGFSYSLILRKRQRLAIPINFTDKVLEPAGGRDGGEIPRFWCAISTNVYIHLILVSPGMNQAISAVQHEWTDPQRVQLESTKQKQLHKLLEIHIL